MTAQSGTGAWSSTVTVVYDVLGNITSKSDIGNYTYGEAHTACGGTNTPGRHAVTTVAGEKNATYCYDANGNMTSGDGRTIAYGASDMVTSITRGSATITFAYGPERARYKRTDADTSGITTTYYIGGKAYEKILRPDASLETKHYIGDFAVITERTAMGSTTRTTAYVLDDHLGSIDVLTDETGAVIQKMSFDAWGKRREDTWMAMANPYSFTSLVTTRGFTGHEQIDQAGLVHMNGRVYDPEIGRFISADPMVQDLSNSQSLNRYTYVLNNPLSMTDPTGFFFGSIFKAIGNFISKIFNAIASAFKAILKIPLIRAAIQIIGCSIGGPIGCTAISGAITLLSGGSIGDALQAMAFTAASAAIWSGVGSFLDNFKTIGFAAFTALKTAVHGVVGGALSMAQGGSFMDGFVANAVGAAAGQVSDVVSQGDPVVDTLIVGAAGGTASVLTGGKFANGAITAAFANLWNKMGPHPKCANGGCDSNHITLQDIAEAFHPTQGRFGFGPGGGMGWTAALTGELAPIELWLSNFLGRFAAAPAFSTLDDITRPGARVQNWGTSVTQTELEQTLANSGWTRRLVNNGTISVFEKNGAKYTVRPWSKSTGAATAEYFPPGSKASTVKIRLEYSPLVPTTQ